VGSRYKVLAASGETIDCVLRGKLRVKGVETTNPVAVGDTVVYELIDDGKSGLITEVLERHNYILRKSSNLSKQSQIIAANLDQALLVVTIILPKTQAEFIDRFLATAEAYRIPAVIIFNKTDLYGREEKEKMEELITLYEDVGYKCQVNYTGKPVTNVFLSCRFNFFRPESSIIIKLVDSWKEQSQMILRT